MTVAAENGIHICRNKFLSQCSFRLFYSLIQTSSVCRAERNPRQCRMVQHVWINGKEQRMCENPMSYKESTNNFPLRHWSKLVTWLVSSRDNAKRRVQSIYCSRALKSFTKFVDIYGHNFDEVYVKFTS